MMRTECLALVRSVVAVFLAIGGNILSAQEGGDATAGKVLFEESFGHGDGDKLPDGWWAEGGQKVWVQDGKLHVRANAEGTVARDRSNVSDYVCTVWNRTVFKGNVRVEFDAHVIASVPGVNNVNFFFLYSDPSGKPLYETRSSRADGDYSRYHQMNGYIVTFLQGQEKIRKYHPDGTSKARFRMRRCPGFKLIDENHDHHCREGVTYHLAVTKRGDRITYAVDGTVYVQAVDPAPLSEGMIGLRTFRTELWWDNIKVIALD